MLVEMANEALPLFPRGCARLCRDRSMLECSVRLSAIPSCGLERAYSNVHYNFSGCEEPEWCPLGSVRIGGICQVWPMVSLAVMRYAFRLCEAI
jgi:hypothetical protein